jgi:cytochrome c oxidase subunit III
MATTVTTDPRERVRGKDTGLRPGAGPRTGGNGARRKPGGDGSDGARYDDVPQRYRIGMWLAVGSIAMLFTALTSAYVMRAGGSGWDDIQLPNLLWVSTGLIVASSVTIEVARRALRRDEYATYRSWLTVSLLFGFGFLAGQLFAWRQLAAQGIYLASNPHSSFFYLLTGLHGLHLLGGILGLSFLLWRATRSVRDMSKPAMLKRRAAADAVGIYWHFMDGLWVYLFALLFLWR